MTKPIYTHNDKRMVHRTYAQSHQYDAFSPSKITEAMSDMGSRQAMLIALDCMMWGDMTTYEPTEIAAARHMLVMMLNQCAIRDEEGPTLTHDIDIAIFG